MIQTRDRQGRYSKEYRKATLGDKIVVMMLILGAISLVIFEEVKQLTQPVYAEVITPEIVDVIEEPKEVLVEIVYTKERIEEIIRQTFTETPNTAVAIAKCESGLDPNIQSRHQLSYGQEKSFGIFQIHVPDWADTATILGFNNFQTDPVENIKLARYIYENYGWNMWTCYTKELYKKYL